MIKISTRALPWFFHQNGQQQPPAKSFPEVMGMILSSIDQGNGEGQATTKEYDALRQLLGTEKKKDFCANIAESGEMKATVLPLAAHGIAITFARGKKAYQIRYTITIFALTQSETYRKISKETRSEEISSF